MSSSSSCEHLIGRVKWFNTKVGYGFITVTDGSRSGTDVFVYHNSINVENQQYKYLVQGEYVEFDLVKSESGNHEWQADRVSGIKGGKLMCETRRDVKISRSEYKSVDTFQKDKPKQQERPKNSESKRRTTESSNEPKQRRPRETKETDNKDWTLVKKSVPNKYRVNSRKGETVITIQSK